MIYCENIVNVALFFFYSSLDFKTTFIPPPPPPPHFHHAIATIVTNFFFPYFGNGIATISLSQFFFSFLFTLGTPRTLHTRSVGIGQRNFSIHITEIQHFLSPFSSSLSYFLLNFGNGDTKIHSLSSQS